MLAATGIASGLSGDRTYRAEDVHVLPTLGNYIGVEKPEPIPLNTWFEEHCYCEENSAVKKDAGHLFQEQIALLVSLTAGGNLYTQTETMAIFPLPT